mgnify:CR=1 FL=1
MKIKNTWFISIIILTGLLILGLQMQGCDFKIIPQEQERREVEFVIVSSECIPDAVATLIEDRKEEEIKLFDGVVLVVDLDASHNAFLFLSGVLPLSFFV